LYRIKGVTVEESVKILSVAVKLVANNQQNKRRGISK